MSESCLSITTSCSIEDYNISKLILISDGELGSDSIYVLVKATDYILKDISSFLCQEKLKHHQIKNGMWASKLACKLFAWN